MTKTWTLMMAGALCMMIVTAACGGEEEGMHSSFRGPLTAPQGSCKAACGKRSAGGCWCDAQCEVFGDCCTDKATFCAKKGCAPTGVACSPDCPENGEYPSLIPCKKGQFNQSTCTCDPLKPTAKTCAQVNGACHALTSKGINCPSGTEASTAGTCAVGGGCCVPSKTPCPPTGIVCAPACPASGQLPGGIPCMAGTFDADKCICLPSPAPTPTCKDLGGKCGALTSTGLQCPKDYTPAKKAATCGLGGGCCLPMAD